VLVIGLTGGIGTGKSEVGRILTGLGAYVIDTDVLAREVVMPGRPALNEIALAFGEEYLHAGELDRKRLADLVFKDSLALKKLNAIVHPQVVEETTKRIAESGASVVVVEVPLLIESGMISMVNQVWVVVSEYELRIKRIMARSSLNREEAISRIASQLGQEEYVAHADVIIDNSGTLTELEEQVKARWEELVRY